MSTSDDRSKLRSNRDKGQAENPEGSHPPSTTSKSSSSNQSRLGSGNGHSGEKRSTDTARKLTKDIPLRHAKRSSPDSGGFQIIEKDELDGQDVPAKDVNSSPVIDPGQHHPDIQKPESNPSRSATSSKSATGITTRSPDCPPQSAQREDQKHDRSTVTTPHTAPGGTDANHRTEMAQKSHHHVSYSEKVKGDPEGAAPAPDPPMNDNSSSRTAEGEPSSAQVGPTKAVRVEESQVAQVQRAEGHHHSDDRGATIVRHPSSSSPPARYMSGFTSGFTSLLSRSTPMMEIPKDELRHLQKEAKEGRQYRKEYESLRNEYNRLMGELRTQGRYVHGVQYENQRLKERMGSLEHELKSVTKKYEEVKSLSETRGKELVGAQVFLSKADSLSISDLGHMVNTLNQEIYQAAASLGDSIVHSKDKISEEDSKQFAEHSKALLGPALAQVLLTAAGKPEEPVHPFLVLVTLQTLLVNFCTKKIHQWTQQEISSTDQFLHALYHEIRSSSEQAVSGRWRALTRGQLKPETKTWANELTAELHGVLMAASWEVISKDNVQSFEAKLEAIFKAVLDARTAIGEKVTSADIEVNVVPPGSQFNKGLMEDEFPDDRQEGRPESVIATTGMGLSKVVPSAAKGALAYSTVLFPKVVLESTLISVFEPPPPPVAKPKRPLKATRPDDKVKT